MTANELAEIIEDAYPRGFVKDAADMLRQQETTIKRLHQMLRDKDVEIEALHNLVKEQDKKIINLSMDVVYANRTIELINKKSE